MSTPQTILTKVKLLRNLSNSPNSNEASAAAAMAERLIEKYNISAAELASLDKQETSYSQDELLYHTFSVVGWMQTLALACAKHFYCYVVQETIRPASGDEEFNYYVYGDDEDTEYVKFVFSTFLKKINTLIDLKCLGRGPIYIDSYCQGVVEAIKNNLSMFGVEIPETKQHTRSPNQEEKVLNNGKSNLSTIKTEKEKPEKESIDINSNNLIKDVMAYFKGIEDGSRLSLQDILELEAENKESEQLEE